MVIEMTVSGARRSLAVVLLECITPGRRNIDLARIRRTRTDGDSRLAIFACKLAFN